MLKNVHASILVCFGGALGFSLATAQFPALDPVRVAPHIYENVLENERVRVLKVTERNGETAPLHSHPERLIVHLSPCAWMEVTSDGETEMQSFKLGDVVWAPPVTHGGDTSRVVQNCSRLEIEMN
ncbi:MAG: hypothetical protein O3A13_11995 [Proteobacteria bacterium]|nr:hypothetical protein [Pseudomonadota bacterium]MDA0994334.1 hypothetical protein [Pseudomonadota bacterium]